MTTDSSCCFWHPCQSGQDTSESASDSSLLISLPLFYSLIINGCIYMKMDSYKSLRVISVLNCLVTSEGAESYSALGIITRQNYHMCLILPLTNKVVETAKIYAACRKSTPEKKNLYLSIHNFQKFKIVTISNLLSTNIWLLLIMKEDLIQNWPYWLTLIRTNF